MSTTRREDLIATLESAKADLESLIQGLDEARMGEPGVTGEWSIKDLLAHMTTWEERIVAWAEALHQGVRPKPAPWPRDWSEEQVNAAIYESNRERPLAEVLERWRQVHEKVVAWVRTLSEEELFQQKVEWLGGASFAEAIPGNSFEHQQIHAGEIKSWLTFIAR